MRPDQLLLSLTPKMAEAVLAHEHPSLEDPLLRRRLQRVAKLKRWDIHIGWIFVSDTEDAHNLIIWFRHAAFGSVGAPATKSAFFSRIAKLTQLIERPAVDMLAVLGAAT